MKDLLLAAGNQAKTGNVGDISSVLTQVSKVTTVEMVFSILFTTIFSVIMYLVFKHVHTKMNYDENFNLMLVMLAFITTILMMLIRTNVALSLGMLGSLSLVRFRTNIKDSRDIGFVFWAMTIGMASANQGYILGILLSVILGGILILANRKSVSSENILLIVRGRHLDMEDLAQDLEAYTDNYSLRAQNLMEDSFEIVYEIKSSAVQQSRLSHIVKGYEGVDTVNLLAPSAEMV